MNDKDLLRRLASLQSVAPDSSWVAKNRAVLSSQISNGAEYAEIKLGFFAHVALFSKRLSQPTSIAALIVLFIATGFVGVSASQKSRPGDPLYIAKTLSEKARLAAEVNEKNKANLNLEFARQRAAEFESIAQANPSDPRLNDLREDFKNELAAARQRLNNLNPAPTTDPAATDPSSESASATETTVSPTVEPATSEVVSDTAKPADENVVIAESNKEKKPVSIPDTLDEAQELFNQQNYDGAIEKLNEATLP